MADGDHGAVSEAKSFCDVKPKSGKACDCGENYRNNCKPDWEPSKRPKELAEKLEPGFTPFHYGSHGNVRGFEAHHILVVSEVQRLPDQENVKMALEMAKDETTWCVNRKLNMVALPLFGHTIKWYCDPAELLKARLALGDEAEEYLRSPAGAPPFKDLPQHDWLHPKYSEEIQKDIQSLWKRIAKALEKHEYDPVDVASELDALSRKWCTQLEKRAKRCKGGTHQAWVDGLDSQKENRSSDWYLSFSMTRNDWTQQAQFPLTWNDRVLEQMEKYKQSLLGAGG